MVLFLVPRSEHVGFGDDLTSVYDRPHRPGDRIPLELHGRQGRRFEVALDGETVYKTQL